MAQAALKAESPASTQMPGRGRIYDSITDTIGNTPIVRLNKIAAAKGVKANLLAKLEFFNPIASVKDRIGVHMITFWKRPERSSPASPPDRATSGNTGIALAFVAAARGYKLILVMPESMSIERRKMLALLGAELVLTPAPQGMKGAVAKAEELSAATPDSVVPRQFDNPANPEIHRLTTPRKSGNDTNGEVDAFVAASAPAHDHRRRAGLEAAQAQHQDHRDRARGFADPVGRPARPA